MSDKVAEAFALLATSVQQLAAALRPSTLPLGPRGSHRWEVVDRSDPVEPGSRAAPGPSLVHHSSLSSSELTARYNASEASFPELPAQREPGLRADQLLTPRPSAKLFAAIRLRQFAGPSYVFFGQRFQAGSGFAVPLPLEQ